MVRIRSGGGGVTVPGAASMSPVEKARAARGLLLRQWPVACDCGARYHSLDSYPYADEGDLWEFLLEAEVPSTQHGATVEARKCRACGRVLSAAVALEIDVQPVAGGA